MASPPSSPRGPSPVFEAVLSHLWQRVCGGPRARSQLTRLCLREEEALSVRWKAAAQRPLLCRGAGTLAF